MNLNYLKSIRVVVALFFFLPALCLFIDIGFLIPAPASNFYTALQIVPSLIKIFTAIGAAAAGALFVIILTVLFGRVYCSTICPLGTYQDIIIWIKRKYFRRKKKRNYYNFSKQYYLLHYSILLITIITFFAGSSLTLDLFEPFSNFGRLVNAFVRPVIVSVNNVFAWILERFGFFVLYGIPLRQFSWTAVVYPFLFGLMIAYLAWRWGRFFCNSLCPAGAFLGLISRYAIFKIVIDRNTCEGCGLCEKVCKARCIDAKTKEIDFAACISCFNCIEACPTVGLVYEKFNSVPVSIGPVVDMNRRNILTAAAGLVSFPVLGFSSEAPAAKMTYDESREFPITPPGSISVGHFSSYCTACHLCISACPTQVLYPAFMDYGIHGIFQPKMNYSVSYCNFDCVICGKICPTGAILPLLMEDKKLVQLGKVIFVKEDCIVETKKTDCGACAEHCPTKAVKMVAYGKLTIPETKEDVCIGCGACEKACPTKPRRAIFVASNDVHQKAKKPEIKKQQNTLEKTGDFPF